MRLRDVFMRREAAESGSSAASFFTSTAALPPEAHAMGTRKVVIE
jgi:hypothetical protein